ncbi:MAG TPA: ROK family protein [bacterium]
MARFALAVDIGGTKILTALVRDDGTVTARSRVETPGDVEPVVEAVITTAGQVLGSGVASPDQIIAVGVGAPGPMNPETGVVYEPPNIKGWHDVPLGALLTERLGMRVWVENDANAAAVAEWWMGAGRGVSDLIYVTVSTGIGGGIIIGDRLLRGVSGTAGEVGHMTIDVNGPPCPCRRGNGHLEALATGPAIARMAREEVEAGKRSVLLEMAGGRPDAITATMVETAAREGDQIASEVFARAAAYLGIGMANLLNIFNPERIVIGGGVSKAGEMLFEPVRRIARERAFERPGRDADIVPAALGDDVGVVGAAAVAFQRVGIPLR